MRQKILFIIINISAAFLIGLSVCFFLVYALGQETNTSQEVEVVQGKEASPFLPSEPSKEQINGTVSLKLSEPLPFFLPEEE